MNTQSLNGEAVLVVDDEHAIRKLIARMVRATGHQVEVAASVAEARTRFAGHEFALAICDLRLPGESGGHLIRWIRDEHPETAVLVATGTNDPVMAEASLALGAVGYLTKPFKRNEVAINVTNALARRRLEIENREYRELLEQRVSKRTAALNRSREETIRRLSLAIEFRSHETGQHLDRIGENSSLLARHLGYDEAFCEMIRVAAVLHDVGKIGIPDAILLKPGRLTDAERSRMEEHAEIGYRLLSGSDFDLLELAAVIARTHHERFDGSGYPRALAGDEIPVAGRITAVADVFDALTHRRVYRPAFGIEKVLEIMREGRGNHFDPHVLDVFMGLIDREGSEPFLAGDAPKHKGNGRRT